MLRYQPQSRYVLRFIDQPYAGTRLESIPPGTRFGPYEILAPIGKGGMGVVYRARDTRLRRDVAIKVLTRRDSRTDDVLGRILLEARIVARLSHPNICTLYDVGSADQIDFLVMELLEGESLSECIRRGPMQQSEVVRIGLQLCEALAAAHRAGVVHRDVKPANVMITRSGAKLMDFGIAQQIAAPNGETTLSGFAHEFAGTVPYMPPEALKAGEIDARSDIFSLGVVMYEMVTNEHPFAASDRDLARRTNPLSPPRSLSQARPGVSVALAAIIHRCLSPSPEDRWQRADDIRDALNGCARRPPRKHGSSLSLRSRGNAAKQVAVLPFDNLSSPDDEFLAEGMTHLVASAISRIGGVRVVAHASTGHYSGKRGNPVEIAKALSANAVVTGTSTRVGQRLHVTCQLLDAVSGTQSWARRYERNIGELEFVQQVIAQTISAELGVQLATSRRSRRPAIRLEPKAQELYLKALYHLNVRTLDSLGVAKQFLAEALQREPNYAPAHSAMADWYIGMSHQRGMPHAPAVQRAKECTLEALRLDPTLAQAHAQLGRIAYFDLDVSGAIECSATAIAHDPNLAVAYATLARAHAATAKLDDALKFAAIAEQLDPISARTRLPGIQAALAKGETELCLAKCEEARSLPGGSDVQISYLRALAMYYAGRYTAALDALEHIAAVTRHASAKVALAYILSQLGRDRGAVQRVISDLTELATRAEATPYDFAELYVGLNEPDKAMDYLQRALELRQPELVGLRIEPFFKSLKGRPDFEELLRAVGVSDD